MAADDRPLFREKLWPPLWIYAATALVIPASLLVFLPISVPAGIGTAIVLYGGIVVILLVSTPVIEVDEHELRAGPARLPLSVVGAVRAADGVEAVAERGVLLDARAWLLLRGWISGVVRIELDDPEDPVPYWLVSTRRGAELVGAVRSGRRA